MAVNTSRPDEIEDAVRQELREFPQCVRGVTLFYDNGFHAHFACEGKTEDEIGTWARYTKFDANDFNDGIGGYLVRIRIRGCGGCPHCGRV